MINLTAPTSTSLIPNFTKCVFFFRSDALPSPNFPASYPSPSFPSSPLLSTPTPPQQFPLWELHLIIPWSMGIPYICFMSPYVCLSISLLMNQASLSICFGHVIWRQLFPFVAISYRGLQGDSMKAVIPLGRKQISPAYSVQGYRDRAS